MSEKKNLSVNCSVCDTRNIKEEDYSHYEEILINAAFVIVNERSKSILNRLPLTINQDNMIELPDDIKIDAKTIHGSYEITGNTAVAAHTLLTVNGPLCIHPGSEAVLAKYEFIAVNGPLKCPKSLEGFLSKITVNGPVSTYPDDAILLKEEFELDKYFPLRAKENGKYYAEKLIMIKDRSVDIAKLVQKNVTFQTRTFIVPESLVEACVPLFDEQVEFVVVPDDMELLYGNTVLKEELVNKSGSKLFVYGKLTVDENMPAEKLCALIAQLTVKGTLALTKEQEALLSKPEVSYDKLEMIKKGRKLNTMLSVKIDNNLLDNSPDGIQVFNTAQVNIAADVAPKTILEKLTIANCAHVLCHEEQESAVIAISKNVAKIIALKSGEDTSDAAKDLDNLSEEDNTKYVNAESYVL